MKVMVNCSTTGKPLFTGIVMDRESFRSGTLRTNVIQPCPYCGKAHKWSKKNVYLK